MWTQPAFPSEAAFTAANRRVEAEKVPGTDNFRLASSPQYHTDPVRFTVSGGKLSSPLLPTAINTTYVNIPQFRFAPGGMFVSVEKIDTNLARKPSAEDAVIIRQKYTDGEEDEAFRGRGIRLFVRNLAEESFTSGGAQEDWVEMTPSTEAVYRLRTASGPGLGSNGDGTTNYGYDVFQRSDGARSNGDIGRKLKHVDLNFPLEWIAVSQDFSDASSLLTQDFETEYDNLRVTFLVYPNPYFSQRY